MSTPVILDSRSQKALELAATAALTWSRLASGVFVIPSQSGVGQWIATPQMCSCPDAARHPEQLCKHSIACAIVQALLDSAAPKAVALPPISDSEAERLFAKL